MVASGLPTDSFLYLGYLPRKSSERKAAIQAVAHLPHTLIFLESPHRLPDSLRDLGTVIGRGGRTAKALRQVIGSIGGRGVRVDIMDSY